MAARTSLSRSVHVNALGSGAHRLHALPPVLEPASRLNSLESSSTSSTRIYVRGCWPLLTMISRDPGKHHYFNLYLGTDITSATNLSLKTNFSRNSRFYRESSLISSLYSVGIVDLDEQEQDQFPAFFSSPSPTSGRKYGIGVWSERGREDSLELRFLTERRSPRWREIGQVVDTMAILFFFSFLSWENVKFLYFNTKEWVIEFEICGWFGEKIKIKFVFGF